MYQKYRILIQLFLAVVLLQLLIAISVFITFDNFGERGAFGDMFGGANSLFSGLAFAGVIYAIFLQSRQITLQQEELSLTRKELSRAAKAQEKSQETLVSTMVADHERRKMQATIEYMRSVRPIWSQLRRELNDHFGNGTLQVESIDKIDKDKDLQRLVRELMGSMEHLSVGANYEVFDEDLIYRMSASYLIRIYKRMDLYIEKAQAKNPYAYIEFKDLIRKFDERRRLKPDPRQTISQHYTP